MPFIQPTLLCFKIAQIGASASVALSGARIPLDPYWTGALKLGICCPASLEDISDPDCTAGLDYAATFCFPPVTVSILPKVFTSYFEILLES